MNIMSLIVYAFRYKGWAVPVRIPLSMARAGPRVSSSACTAVLRDGTGDRDLPRGSPAAMLSAYLATRIKPP